MRIATIFLFTLLMMSLSSCGDIATEDKSETDNSESAAQNNGPVELKDLPILPGEIANRLVNELDNIDYQFADLPISMNMNTPSAIRQSLSHISNQGIVSSENCEPTGNIWYVGNGEIILEAEFYLGDGCNFFVFSENGEKKWTNAMTMQGTQFYTMTKQRAGFE